MIIGSYAGIRPKLVSKGQVNFGDFVIEESKKVEDLINLIGIESPGLTASIPIAEMTAVIIHKKHPLKKNIYFKPDYKEQVQFALLDVQSQDTLISLDKNYGEIICRCKTITKAEILQALRNPLGVNTITSIKNRTHATMGRCQGGYCFSRIAAILEEEQGIDPQEISYRYYDDHPFTGRVK
jgi:glycerol-3-phosphate dehydrogenase